MTVRNEPLQQHCVSNQELSSYTFADCIPSNLLALFLKYKVISDTIVWRKHLLSTEQRAAVCKVLKLTSFDSHRMQTARSSSSCGLWKFPPRQRALLQWCSETFSFLPLTVWARRCLDLLSWQTHSCKLTDSDKRKNVRNHLRNKHEIRKLKEINIFWNQ